MIRFIKILSVLLFVLSFSLFAQKSRTAAMGGLSFSVNDVDESFDPFMLGGNSAWLVNSIKNKRLEISPAFNSDFGNYRRLYSAERVNNYGVNFKEIQPLGNYGTFMGTASYDYEVRRKDYRNLKYEPYAGEGFFYTDTTTGNTTYNGPYFELSHSLRLMNSLYIGGAIGYRILNGLKDVYTYGETVFRNVNGNIGIAYQLNNSIIIGLSYSGFDSQERIESSDINLMTVRTFEWRGETHFVELRGSSQDYKINKEGNNFSAQFYYHPNLTTEVGVTADYGISNTKELYPQGSLIDVEDGYAQFNNVNIKLRARHRLSEKFLSALSLDYYNTTSWSENSKREMKIWDWQFKGTSIGVGGSYNINKKMIVGVEYRASVIYSDSSKYIDNRYFSRSVVNHYLIIGSEYIISDNFSLRAGFDFGYFNHDFRVGGNNVTERIATLGVGYNFNNTIQLDGYGKYGLIGLNSNEKYRSYLNWVITLRFFTF